jgi:ADP-ribosylation factor GTPase-activating protein 2/3
LYKEEIARRIAEDVVKCVVPSRPSCTVKLITRNPNGIHIDGLELTPLGTATPNPEPADDFFSTWDKEKPKAPTSSQPPSKSSTPPPSIGAKPVSRTVTSSSLRSSGPTSSTTRPAVSSRLASSTTAGAAPKSSKLGAKKAVGGINFEEAQRKAIEEEERIKRLGYDKIKEEEEAKKIKEREAEERRKAAAAGERISRTSTPVNASSSRKEEKVAPARLGFGQTAGAAVVAQPKA